jgi:hypothetical protein
MRIKMKVISEQEGSHGDVVGEGSRSDPVVIRGTGPHSFVCGACGAVLVEGVRFGQVESISIRCATCGSLNAIPRVMGGDSASES